MQDASQPLGARSRSASTDRTPLLGNSKATTTTKPPVVPLQHQLISDAQRQQQSQQAPMTAAAADPASSVYIDDTQAAELEQQEAAGGSTNSISGRLQRFREHYHIDTNVQIGLEMLPPFGGKVMFYSWYFVLIAAIILQTDLNWQYQCSDVCANRQCFIGKVNKIPVVSSEACAAVQTVRLSALTTAAPPLSNYLLEPAFFGDGKNNNVDDNNANSDNNPNSPNNIEYKYVESTNPLFTNRDASNVIFMSEAEATDYFAAQLGGTVSSSLEALIHGTYCSGNTSEPATRNTTTCGVSWNGGFENIIDSKLNRFMHLRFSMPRPRWPNETVAEVESTLTFQVTFILALKNATAISDKGDGGTNLLTRVPVSCSAGSVQCDAVTIPVVFGSISNASTFTLLAYGVPTLAYVEAIRAGSVQAVFQKAGYTIATLVIRYVFFVAVVIQLIQLLYARYTIWNHLKHERIKKEKREKRIAAAQARIANAAALRAQQQQQQQQQQSNNKNNINASDAKQAASSASDSDANKKAAAGGDLNSDSSVTSQQPQKEHLGEFEQNWATLLNVMLLLYMNPFFAVSVYVVPTPGFFDFLEYKIPLYFVVTVVLCVLALCLATLETKPSYTTRASLVIIMLVILVLDLTDSGKRGWHFNTVECVNFECSGLRWAVLAIIILLIVIIGFLLFYLHRNLATLPYLATRPRQLSMRLMIFIFTSYVVYYVVSTVVGLILFSHNDMLDQSHSELRIGTIMCAFVFVSIITTAFKFVLRTDRIPPHPSDPRWKRVVWTPQWYTWLALHGGGAYIFFSEEEEEEFDVVQDTKQDNISDASWGDDEEEDEDEEAAAAGAQQQHQQQQQDPSETGSASGRSKKNSNDDDDDDDDEISNTWRRRKMQSDARLAAGGGAGGSARRRNRAHSRTQSQGALSADAGALPHSSGYAGYVPPHAAASAGNLDQLDATAAATDSPPTAIYASGPFGGSNNNNHNSNGLSRGYATHVRTTSGGSGSNEDTSSLSARMFRRIDSLTSINEKDISKMLRRPAKIIDKMEDTVLGAANLFKLVSSARPPFMNLETAIDLFNLSYEAYGVAVSKGDAKITTGITVTEAYAKVKSGAKRIVCCCCEADDDPNTTQYHQFGRSSGHDVLENQSFDFGNSPTANGGGGSPSHPQQQQQQNARLFGNGRSSLPPTAAQQHQKFLKEQAEKQKQEQLQKQQQQRGTSPPTASFTRSKDSGNFTPPHSGRSMPTLNTPTASASLSTNTTNATTNLRASAASTSDALIKQATAIYGPDGKPPIHTEKYGYKQLLVHEANAVQVVISEMDVDGCARHTGKHPRYVIAFRGTDNQENFIQDFRFTREVWREMQKELSFVNSLLEAKVHSGFLSAWVALQQVVLEKMAELISRNPTHRVFVTGHSLGGAIAGLCGYTIAVRFRRMFVPQNPADANRMVQVYTFGMPKLGDYVFRDEYNKKVPFTFRIVNESDTVSGVGVFMGHHVGTEVCIDRHGNFICNPMPVEKLFRPTQGKGLSLKHHSMYGYGASMNRIAAHTSLGMCPSRCLDPYIPWAEPISLAAAAAAAAASSGGGSQPNLSKTGSTSSAPRSRSGSQGPPSARAAAVAVPIAEDDDDVDSEIAESEDVVRLMQQQQHARGASGVSAATPLRRDDTQQELVASDSPNDVARAAK